LQAENTGNDFWTVSEEDLIYGLGYRDSSTIDIIANSVEINGSIISNIDTGNTELVPEESTSQLIEQPIMGIQQIDKDGNPTLNQATMLNIIRPQLTAEERSRALEALQLCRLLRHPGDESVVNALNNGIFTTTHLTSQDLRNARAIYGPCSACREGKMLAPTEPTSISEPSRGIGNKLHTDLIILKSKSIGGNTLILTTCDEKSSYIVGVPCVSKKEAVLKEAGLLTLIEFNSHGHTVKTIITDDEVSLATLKKCLGPMQVAVEPTPAGLHEKRIESYIGTIKERRNAMVADLWYEVPSELECELYMDAIRWLNRLPNKNTGPFNTPFSLFTGNKTFIPKYYWGQTGLFYDKKDDKDSRSIWGIFIGYGSNAKYLRCYNPLTKSVTSKRKFVPMTSCPTAWNLKHRLRNAGESKMLSSVSVITPAMHTAQPLIMSDGNKHAQTGLLPSTIGSNSITRDIGGDLLLSTNPLSHSEGVHSQSLNRSSSEGVADYDGTKSNDTDYNGTKSNDTDYNGTKSNETNFDGTTTSDPNDLVTKEKHRFNRSRDTLANNVENVRSTRSKGNWKDGPNGAKDTEFWSGKQKFKAKLCLINDIKNPHGPFRILAMKASIRTALKNKERRDSIVKSIEVEIDNLEQPGVLTPTRFKNIPHEYRKL
jgi:hypothetical protein